MDSKKCGKCRDEAGRSDGREAGCRSERGKERRVEEGGVSEREGGKNQMR